MERAVRKDNLWLVILAASLAIAGPARAQQSSPPDSLSSKRNSLVALPYAYYTPETKFAFGAGGVYSFRPSESAPTDRPSSLRIALTYTQLNQIILALLPEIYFKEEEYYFGAFYGYYHYPNKFWGIGSETQDSAEEGYEQNDFESSTEVQRQVLPGLYVGLRFQYQRMEVKDPASTGILRTGAIPGSRGGTASGLGVVINHDTRDHVYQPSKGFYNRFCAMFFGGTIGSDYTFTALSVDLRRYFAVFGSHVIALQMYDGFILGDSPFQMMNLLGGSYSMRGYYKGRYRDKNMITFQGEYRLPVYWRIGAVGFAGLGDVADDIAAFRLDRFKYSLGFGFRFKFDAREKINARLDVGFGKGGNAGIYAMVLEAF
jgi:hypothetical protein